MEETATSNRVTLLRLANEAGVSLSTVSKVLNGRPDVAKDTQSKVEGLLEQHGYERRVASSPAAPLVEMVFAQFDSSWSMELIRGVSDVAREHRASVVLSESGTWHAPGPEWIGGVLRRRPLGVVIVMADLPRDFKNKLRSSAIPFVIIDPAGDPASDVPSVGSANWAGGLAATRHLIDRGHKRVAIITGPEHMLCSMARLAGYRSAMGMAGLPVDPNLVRFGDFAAEGGRDHALDLLSGPDRPTAIFAGSDLQALGVIEAARLTQLSIPGDLSVVGYDDIPMARWSSPALTTVHQPLREMGEEATRLVLRLRNGDDASTRVELATSLVVRESTAAPRAKPTPARAGAA